MPSFVGTALCHAWAVVQGKISELTLNDLDAV